MELRKNTEIVLAIHPFENLTEGNGLEVFCKSLYIDLVTELSRFRQFKILACESLVNTEEVGSDYTIRGSFRFHNEVLRINAQLLNSETNQIAWADRYEGDKASIFTIQEDLLREIVSTLQQQLNYDLLIHLRKKSPVDLTAYECWLYGMDELKKGTVETDEIARKHFKQAIDIDPSYSLAYSGMSLTYFNEWSCQLWDRWDVSQKGAFEWALKAFHLDEQNYVAALVLGRVYLYQAEYEIAEHYLRRALRLNQNDIDNLIQAASCFVFLGYAKEAERLYQKVLQLNPLNKKQYDHIGAYIAFELGEFEKCIELGPKTNAPWVDFNGILAAAYYRIGDADNMKICWQAFLKDFQKKILQGKELDESQAIQWLININPVRHESNLLAFWEFISGKNISLSSRVIAKGVELSDKNCFVKENGWWRLSYEGKTIQMTEVKGFLDMYKLLENPETEFHCTSLFGGSVTNAPELVFDEKAKQSYKRKIQELQEEIRASEDNNDLGRTTQLQQEYSNIVDHLTSSLGKGGKTRKLNDPMDKIRSAVTWRIRNAIQKIEKNHPALGRHLSASIKTGLFCSYSPEKPVEWILAEG